MDIELIKSIKQAFTTIGLVLTTLKQAKDLLPENAKKEEVSIAIDNAERQFKIAEPQTAKGMGYRLCKKHFPPEIMLSADEDNWKCPVCGNEIKLQKSKHPFSNVKGL